MLISLIKFPITNLGPGKRIGIWTSGCKKNCLNCMSSNAKQFDEKLNMSIDDIMNVVKEYNHVEKIEGVTISGGEPFDQHDLFELIQEIRKIGIDDILIYTGYLIEELENQMDTVFLSGVIIDGPYVDELNDNRPLRGSSNQRVLIINKSLKEKYEEYLKLPRQFDLYFENDYFLIIGILPKGGQEIISKLIKNMKI